MRRLPVLFAAVMALVATRAAGADFTVTGRFQYEDRIWDGAGYTGAAQDLPIRRADVEVVNATSGGVIGAGSTDAAGNYAVFVSGQSGTVSLYVRCLSATDRSATYHLKVVTTFTRTGGTVDLTGSAIHAITTTTVAHDAGTPSLDMGTYRIQDGTGQGVAQAFNILDCAVDAVDLLARPEAIGRYPTASEFVVYGWNGASGSSGSNYLWQGIYITSTASDNDGWSDAVILHETGHWMVDLFSADHNPGGTHFIGDNGQDPRLSYGEGLATHLAAQVREFRSARLNGAGQPVDAHVSVYADLAIAPPVGTPGALEFGYDYETGLYTPTAVPVGQAGSACETNVTSALWDLLDGASTPDESPGADDEPGDETGMKSWSVFKNHVPGLPEGNAITVEDFWSGWFAVHGAGHDQAAMNAAFLTLAGMPFAADGLEPDGDTASAVTATVLAYSLAGGGVVINECEMAFEDQVELMNTGTSAVSLGGWKIQTSRNGYATTTYTFPAFTLYPGSFVVLHEGGSSSNNGPVHLWGGTFTIPWFNTDDGACTLRDAGNVALDFVRWDNVSGSDPSTTPVPSPLTWSGSVFSVPAGVTLSRNANGADTHAAGDFAPRPPSLDAPNPDAVPERTLYPAGDADVLRIHAQGGQLLGVRAESPHSAGEPQLEIRNAAGSLLGTNARAHGIKRLAELSFVVPATGVYYATVRHVGPYTDWAPLSYTTYVRPSALVLGPPAGLAAIPDNEADVGDRVVLSWLNGGQYDSVRVSRDGVRVAGLPGNATGATDFANRGQHTYTVTGWLGGSQSAPASTFAFAGILSCYHEEDMEGGTGELVLDAPWGLVSSPVAEGAWSLTDSPGGDYASNRNLSAVIVVPSNLRTFPSLTFEHICITEAGYDFGIVEISTDFGNTWTELARYDMDDHPGWSDGVADPGDWVQETIDLNPYIRKKVTVRFRLSTDGSVTEDGWFVDRVAVSDTACAASADLVENTPPVPFFRAGPNPFSSRLDLLVEAPAGTPVTIDVFDVAGRRVRRVHEGPIVAPLAWDGRDAAGRAAAGGVYFLRAAAGERRAVRRVVKLSP